MLQGTTICNYYCFLPNFYVFFNMAYLQKNCKSYSFIHYKILYVYYMVPSACLLHAYLK